MDGFSGYSDQSGFVEGKEMVFKETQFKLKDGRDAFLRSPCEKDAEEMLQFIIKASDETDYLMKYPEEYADFTLEQEKGFLNEAYQNENVMMIASVAIALLQEFWNLGIGTRMFEELIRIAKERDGVCQIELDFIEGNSRARCLYEKMGFRITGVKPDAIRMKDGTFVNEYMMVKRL